MFQEMWIPIVCLGEISFFMILNPFFHCYFYVCSNAAAIFSAVIVLFNRCFCVNSTQWFMTFKTKTHSNLIFFVFNVKFPIDIHFFKDFDNAIGINQAILLVNIFDNKLDSTGSDGDFYSKSFYSLFQFFSFAALPPCKYYKNKDFSMISEETWWESWEQMLNPLMPGSNKRS